MAASAIIIRQEDIKAEPNEEQDQSGNLIQSRNRILTQMHIHQFEHLTAMKLALKLEEAITESKDNNIFKLST